MVDDVGGNIPKDAPVHTGEPQKPESEKLIAKSVIPQKKKSSKLWYVLLIIIVLAAGYYSYSKFYLPESVTPVSPLTGAAAATPTETPAQATPTQPAAEPAATETPAATTTPEKEPETAPNCNDNNACTIDLLKTDGLCEHTPISNCCGNGICEDGERCDALTLTTICKQDCPLSCPATLVGRRALTDTNNLTAAKAITCNNGACEALDEAEFKITGQASLKTFVINLGERASEPIAQQFACNYLDNKYNEQPATNSNGALTRLGQKLTFSGYFDNNDLKKISDSIAPQQSLGQKYTVYNLGIQPIDMQYPTTIECMVWLTSTDFSEKQTFKRKYVPNQ